MKHNGKLNDSAHICNGNCQSQWLQINTVYSVMADVYDTDLELMFNRFVKHCIILVSISYSRKLPLEIVWGCL